MDPLRQPRRSKLVSRLEWAGRMTWEIGYGNFIVFSTVHNGVWKRVMLNTFLWFVDDCKLARTQDQ